MKKLLFLLPLLCFGAFAQNMSNPMDTTDYAQRSSLIHPGYNNGVYYFVDENGNVQLAAPRLFPTVSEMRTNWYPMPGVMYTLHERGKEGPFRLSMRDSTSADDGLNVIITGYGQRMKRVGNPFSMMSTNRINHTGTQTSSTISDFTQAARTAISASGSLSYNAATGVISYNSPALAPVALSNNYGDLTGRPTLSALATSGSWNDLLNKPDLSVYYLASNPAGYITNSSLTWNNITGKPTSFPVAWADVTGKPTIPATQIQSDWAQTTPTALDFIKNKPTIPAAQIQVDWNQGTTTALDFIKNKPVLAAVATAGTWASLTGKPTFATVATTGSYMDLINRPTLATVSATGAYADLTGKPTIPAAQIQSDWNQTNTASLDFIKNKPVINTPVSNNVTRALNASFQVSTTRGAFVSYSVKITATITLVVGQSTTVFLETSPDGTTWTSMQSNDFGVNAGIALTMSSTVGVSCFVPAGYFVRIRTAGNAPAVYSSGNETLL